MKHTSEFVIHFPRLSDAAEVLGLTAAQVVKKDSVIERYDTLIRQSKDDEVAIRRLIAARDAILTEILSPQEYRAYIQTLIFSSSRRNRVTSILGEEVPVFRGSQGMRQIVSNVERRVNTLMRPIVRLLERFRELDSPLLPLRLRENMTSIFEIARFWVEHTGDEFEIVAIRSLEKEIIKAKILSKKKRMPQYSEAITTLVLPYLALYIARSYTAHSNMESLWKSGATPSLKRKHSIQISVDGYAMMEGRFGGPGDGSTFTTQFDESPELFIGYERFVTEVREYFGEYTKQGSLLDGIDK